MDKPKKSLGQHWLQDEAALQAMCQAVDVGKDDVVLEIGPGQGSLTKILASKAKQVIAVELDETLVADLNRQLASSNVDVVQHDILQFDLTQLPASYKVVANIPYYLTSHLIKVLSESSNPPSVAALLVQQEVAERAAAQPGDMSLLAVLAQFYWQVSLGRIVPAELFTPPPKVNSQILMLERRKELLFPDVDAKDFFRVVAAGFSQKRKTLENSLSAGLHISKDEAKQMLESAKINSGVRPQNLRLDEWYELLKSQIKN